MSEIDWSKAPEGATHFSKSSSRFFKQDSLAYRWDDTHWTKLLFSDLGEYSWARSLIERPSPQAWSGEGLPPVGTVCETWFDDGKACWHECEVIHHKSDDHRLAAVILRGQHKGRLCWGMDFRPIRTPEQIAAEAREKAIDEMVGLMCQDGAFDHEDPEAAAAMGKLYDAGYRKVDNP